MSYLFHRRRTRVRMIVSVGDHVAGKTYKLPLALADHYLAKHYAAKPGTWTCRDCGSSSGLEFIE